MISNVLIALYQFLTTYFFKNNAFNSCLCDINSTITFPSDSDWSSYKTILFNKAAFCIYVDNYTTAKLEFY
jgi:hypothetical protein